MNIRTKFPVILGIAVAVSMGLVSLIPSSEMRATQARAAWGTQSASSRVAGGAAVSRASAAAEWGKLPLRFEANEGQAGDGAQFIARGPGYGVLLGGAEVTLVLDRPSKETLPARSTPQDRLRAAQRRVAERAVVRMELMGANRSPAAEGIEKLETETNYFIGNDPSRWHRKVANYARVRYRDVYPGVDVIYYGKESRLEYDLRVAAGRNPDDIRMRYAGAESMRVDRDGALVLGVKGSEIRQSQPKAYQMVAGVARPVEARYALSRNEVRFELGAYDHSRELVIDPAVVYSTYFGGNGTEFGFGIAVDGSGNVYLTGSTLSTNLPATGTIGPANKNGALEDVFVVKLDANAHSVTYCDYIGGSNFDEAQAIAVDATGAYIGGDTASNNFPTTGGSAQAAFKGTVGTTTNGWLAKLNPAGSALVYATYLGGGGSDAVNNLTVDGSGIVYATGFTNSSGATPFPTTAGVFQKTFGGTTGGPGSTGDAFVTKLSANGTAFVYSTYLGGVADEQGSAIVIDGSGNAFVAGDTNTQTSTAIFPNPPSVGVIQPGPPAKNGGGFSGWIAEVNAGATALTYFTYLGGNGDDHVQGMTADGSGNLYVTGRTRSTNFPVMPNPGAAQTAFGGGANFGDAFVTKVNATGTAILYSTYLGGSGDDAGQDIRVDANGFAYVVGLTTGNFPVTAIANQGAIAGAQNAFIAKLRPNGTQVVYASYHGGNGRDSTEKMALDASNNVFFTGFTTSTTFPATPNSGATAVVQTANGGGQDAFAVKLDASAPVADLTPVMLAFGNQLVTTTSTSQAVTYTNNGNATLTIASIAVAGEYTQTNNCGMGAGNTFPSTLAAGASCTINVSFAPTTLPGGARNGTLTATDNAAGSPHNVMLTGTSQAPTAMVAPSSLVFGNQNVGTSSAPQMATLTNSGNSTLNIKSITLLPTGPNDFAQTNNCGATLAPAASCTFTVTFSPIGGSAAGQQRFGSIQITDDSQPTSTQIISLQGTGTTPAGGTFTLFAVSTSVTIHPGQTATFAFLVIPAGGFNQSVGLTCTGAPALATCNVLPNPVTPNGQNSSSATAVVTTTARSTLGPRPFDPRGTPPWTFLLLAAMMVALAAGMMTAPVRARMRYAAPVALVVLIVGLTVFASACGSNGSAGTPTGTSVLMVTGTGGGQTQTLNFTLIVQ